MSIISRILGFWFKLPAAETHDIVVDRNIRIPMADGASLLADHYYPRKDSQLPLILVRSVYGRGNLSSLLYGHLFAERGFQVLIQSCRGTFGSGGTFNPFFNEHSDGLDTLAWIKKQPWFNGQLATAGMSYLGYVQWAMAADAIPTLKAMSVTATASQFRGQTYPGDAFSLQDPLSWTCLVNVQERSAFQAFMMMFGGKGKLKKAFQLLPLGKADRFLLGKEVPFWQDWLKHSQPDYAWWKPADFSRTIKRIDVPVNMVTGWYDIFLPWQIADYMELKKAGNPPHLSIGPWAHTDRKMMGYGARETLAWFKVQLKNQKAILRKSPVVVFVMGLNQWKDFPEWPPQAYQAQHWYLQPAKKLSPEKPPVCGPDLYVFDPADPTPSVGGAMMAEAGPKDNRKLEARPDVLTFTSDTLDQDTEVIGPVSAEMYVRSNLPCADFFVRLCDVYPAGKSMNICDGIRRIRPGQPVADPDGCIKLIIELWPTAYMFKRGHRIRLQLSSGAFPHFARNSGSEEPLTTGITLLKAEQQIYHDPMHPSSIILPVKIPQ